jgi:hypothetical protein
MSRTALRSLISSSTDLVVNGQRVEVPRKDMMAEEIRAFVEYVDGKRKDNPMPVCPYAFTSIICSFMIGRRDLHLAHRALGTPVGSWAAVGPNGTGPPSTGIKALMRLGAEPPSPPRALRRRL